MKFENFLIDIGERPEDKTLDRKDNDKGYCKENCKWATQKEQQNNSRNCHYITYKNITKSLAQWAEYLGINAPKIQARLKYGWSI
jgi:hypothetical protein